jgi:hypothetical protein
MKQLTHRIPVIIIFLFALLFTAQAKEQLTNKVTPKHVLLPSIQCEIYLIPPDTTFKMVRDQSLFGYTSSKLGMTISMTMDNQSIREARQLLNSGSFKTVKTQELHINDFDMIYYKLEGENDAKVAWLFFASNDFFDLVGEIHYKKADDKKYSSKIEKSLRSFIVKRNPNIFPTTSSFLDGDFTLIPLKFVQLVSTPVTYFTEDGVPLAKTKGTKFVAIATVPMRQGDTTDIAEVALENANILYRLTYPNDTLVAEKVDLMDEFAKFQGLHITGSVASNDNRVFDMYFSASKKTAYILFSMCDAKDATEFFKAIKAFSLTAKPIYE